MGYHGAKKKKSKREIIGRGGNYMGSSFVLSLLLYLFMGFFIHLIASYFCFFSSEGVIIETYLFFYFTR